MESLPNQQPERWVAGHRVGRYSIVAPLAQGGMAQIFLARHDGAQGFEKLVVLKRIDASYAADPGFMEMFRDEARISANLTHPNIVQVFELGEEEGALFIAMEYLPGESLAATLAQGVALDRPLPLPFAVKLISDAAAALHYAHTTTGASGQPLQIVHRDISPQNLLVTYAGNLKVVDFGIAKATIKASRTVFGQVKGKLHYMAPEQALNGVVDARSDLFSLGLVLFEAVTQTLLYSRELTEAEIVEHLKGIRAFPVASQVEAAVPEPIDKLLQRAMALDPANRFQTAAAFHEELEGWLREEKVAPTALRMGEYLGEIFKERIQEREGLVKASLRDEFIEKLLEPAPRWTGNAKKKPAPRVESSPPEPSLTKLPRMVPDPSSSGSFIIEIPESTSPSIRRPRWRALGLGGASLGAATMLIWGAMRSGWSPKPPAHPPHSLDAIDRLPETQARPSSGAVAAPPSVAPPPATADRAPPGVAPDLTERRGPAQVPHKRVEHIAKGRLSLNTSPGTEVYFHGARLGETPLSQVSLPAGKVRLLCVNKGRRIHQEIVLDIPANRSLARSIKF